MTIYIPYFYIIQDTRSKIYYAGVKYGKGAKVPHYSYRNLMNG